jgi:hypothetical protein
MTSPNSEFWRAVIRMGGGIADPQRWRHHAPTSVEFHQAGLLRDAGPASVVYRPDNDGIEQAYRVVRHGPDDLVGVPEDNDGEAIPLKTKDAEDWSVHWPQVRSALVAGLNLEGAPSEVPGARSCYRLGTAMLDVDVAVTVFLATSATALGLSKGIAVICSSADSPAVVLVPSTDCINGDLLDRASRRRVAVVSLADRVALRDKRLVGWPLRDAVFAEQRSWHGLETGETVLYAFSPVGEGWDLVFAGTEARIIHRKGLLYLHLLLEPAESHSVAATALKAAVEGVDERIFKSGGARQNIDDALKAIWDRIREIDVGS